MKKISVFILIVAVLIATLGVSVVFGQVSAQQGHPMTFFVTSVGLGDGANLGGLEGADAHCQALAEEAGAGDRTWRAYLSAAGEKGTGDVHARDRIGSGPWYNFKGVQVAASVADRS